MGYKNKPKKHGMIKLSPDIIPNKTISLELKDSYVRMEKYSSKAVIC